MLAASDGGYASHAAGRASASVVDPLSVTAERDLDFGLLETGRSGTVVVSAVDPVSRDGTGPATFLVRGGPLLNYRVKPERRAIARGRSTGAEVEVTDLTVATKNLGRRDWTGRLDVEGKDRVAVGGTITLPADAPADRYVAEVLVMVSYE
ncbi:DUF4402 domain-containing protein [Erythrobacter aureus]|nr:DUF4402 domain-containing protein [Erythrobacter aureus]